MATTPITADSAHDNSARAAWDALLAQYLAVEAIPIDEATDETIDLAGELSIQIMAMPAPDNAALIWKLDYILEPNDKNDSTPSWSKDFIEQAVADYRRILTEGGDHGRD